MHMDMLVDAIMHATVAGVIGFFVLFAASKSDGIVKLVGTLLGWWIWIIQSCPSSASSSARTWATRAWAGCTSIWACTPTWHRSPNQYSGSGDTCTRDAEKAVAQNRAVPRTVARRHRAAVFARFRAASVHK